MCQLFACMKLLHSPSLRVSWVCSSSFSSATNASPMRKIHVAKLFYIIIMIVIICAFPLKH